MAAVLDRKAIMRDKRAQGIAAMGLVNREGDRFRVTTPSLRGKRNAYEVWRDEAGRVRCTCLEFEEMSAAEPSFRCEHILAVKHALLNKSSEPVTKRAAQNPVAQAGGAQSTADVSAETPNTKDEDASEKRTEATQRAETLKVEAASRQPRFVREQAATEQTEQEDFAAPHVGSLAINEETEEQKAMSRNQTANAQETQETEAEGLEFETEETFEETRQATASVVPLAFKNKLRTLRQPIDPNLVKTREGWTDRNGNMHMVEYVEWHTVADILDRVAPTWSHSVRNVVQIGDMVAVTAAITIDNVTREGVGTGTADNETGIKKAEHDALKRAAIKFGIARELYQRESEVIERDGAGPQPGEFPRDPLAKSMADLVTPKQLGMIRALAREAGVDAEAECQAQMRCRTEELSKRAASSLIDHLKSVQREAAGGMRRAS